MWPFAARIFTKCPVWVCTEHLFSSKRVECQSNSNQFMINVIYRWFNYPLVSLIYRWSVYNWFTRISYYWYLIWKNCSENKRYLKDIKQLLTNACCCQKSTNKSTVFIATKIFPLFCNNLYCNIYVIIK